MLSKEAALAILELSQWYAHEKLIEFTNAFENGERDQYREMNRMEEIIDILKKESQRIERGRNV